MFSVITSVISLILVALFLSNKQFNKKLLSCLVLFGVGTFFISFLKFYFNQEFVSESFMWLKGLSLSFNFDYKSLLLIAPCVIIAFSTNLLNVIQKKQDAIWQNVIVLFTSVLFLLIIGASNVVQILIGTILVDILAIYLIYDNQATKNKFVFYNFIADSLLFFAFSIIFSTQDSFNIEYLSSKNIKVLPQILFSISVAIKLGLFLLNGYFFNIKDFSSTQIISFLFCATPISGALLSYKLPFLLLGFFNYWLLISAVVYLFIFIKEENLNLKIITFSLASLSISIFLSESVLFFASLFLIFPLLFVIIAASLETSILLMGAFIKKAKVIYLISLLSCLFYINCLLPFINNYYVLGFLTLSLIGFSLLLRRVFFTKFSGFEEVFDNIKFPNISIFIPFVTVFFFLFNDFSSLTFIIFAIFIISQFIPLERLFAQKSVDNVSGALFIETLVNVPPKILGRVLWLVIDFLIIQKTLVVSSTSINSKLFNQYKKLENKNVVWVSLGFVLLLLIVGVKFYG